MVAPLPENVNKDKKGDENFFSLAIPMLENTSKDKGGDAMNDKDAGPKVNACQVLVDLGIMALIIVRFCSSCVWMHV
jgi:hypothetical protein